MVEEVVAQVALVMRMYSMVAARLSSNAFVNSASVAQRPVDEEIRSLRLVASVRNSLQNHFIFPLT